MTDPISSAPIQSEIPGARSDAVSKARTETYLLLIAVTAIAGIASWLRFHHIGRHELWFDEAFSVYFVTKPGEAWFPEYLHSVNALYYLLLKGWFALAGYGTETLVRLPSALFGLLFVLAIIWSGKEFMSLGVGLWAGLFAAIAPIHVHYSQEARAYALLTLLILITQTLTWRAVHIGTWKAWILAGVAAWLTLISHGIAAFALSATFCLVLWRTLLDAGSASRIRAIAATLLCTALVAPFVPWEFLFTGGAKAGTSWVRHVWESIPPWRALPTSLEGFGIGPSGLDPRLSMPRWLRNAALGTIALVLLCTAVPWNDGRLGIREIRERKLWVGTMLLAPLLLMWGVSFYHPLYVPGRYDMVAFPAFSLLIGLGFAKLWHGGRFGPVLTVVMALVLFLALAVSLGNYYKAPSPSFHRLTAQILDREVQQDELVVFADLRGLPTLYYLTQLGYQWHDGACTNRQTGKRFACRLYPRANERLPGVAHDASPESALEDVRSYLVAASRPSMVWVVFGKGKWEAGRFLALSPDDLLVDTLQRLGFEALRLVTGESQNIAAFHLNHLTQL
jgi:4-amino-4-deoxy-L-arabinose transferase-like glycosyltransferase